MQVHATLQVNGARSRLRVAVVNSLAKGLEDLTAAV